jgi:hypothetical protein
MHKPDRQSGVTRSNADRASSERQPLTEPKRIRISYPNQLGGRGLQGIPRTVRPLAKETLKNPTLQ